MIHRNTPDENERYRQYTDSKLNENRMVSSSFIGNEFGYSANISNNQPQSSNSSKQTKKKRRKFNKLGYICDSSSHLFVSHVFFSIRIPFRLIDIHLHR